MILDGKASRRVAEISDELFAHYKKQGKVLAPNAESVFLRAVVVYLNELAEAAEPKTAEDSAS